MPPDDPIFREPDLKTLRLATPELDERRLLAFIAYQRALLEEARRLGFAASHERAQAASGLTGKEVSRIAPVVADFAGRRWTAAQLTQKLEATEARRRAGTLLNMKERELLEKLPKELARARDPAPLAQRYGAELVSLLLAHEAELVSLHEQVTAAQRDG